MSNVKEVKDLAQQRKITTVADFFEQKKDLIAQSLPNTITPERLIGVFTMVLGSSPELKQCSQNSLIAAVIQTVQYGLTPGNIGHCHYIPFNNKQKDGSYKKEVQFILGVKGIVELVNRCGKAVILSTEVVYENDGFTYEQGLNPILKHVPADKDRGEIKGVYCVAKNLVANEKLFIYLNKADIDKVRQASKAGQSNYSPWATWYSEMAKKTAIKRICKLLPISVDIQQQVASDETIKTDINKDMKIVPDKTEWEEKAEEAEIVANEDASQTPDPVESPKNEPQQENKPEANSSPDFPKYTDPKLISEKQEKRLLAIASKNGHSRDDVKIYVSYNYDYSHLYQISKDNYEAICSNFEQKGE